MVPQDQKDKKPAAEGRIRMPSGMKIMKLYAMLGVKEETIQDLREQLILLEEKHIKVATDLAMANDRLAEKDKEIAELKAGAPDIPGPSKDHPDQKAA